MSSMADSLDIRRIIPGADIENDTELKDQIRLPEFLRKSIGIGTEGGPSLKDASFHNIASPAEESRSAPMNEFSTTNAPFSTGAGGAYTEEYLSEYAPSDHEQNDIVRIREEVPASLRQAVPSSPDAAGYQFDNSKNNDLKTDSNEGRANDLAAPLPDAPSELGISPADAQASEELQLQKEKLETQMERLNSAIEVLRSTSQALGEQARSDAVEIGFEVARHLLKQEVTQSVSSVMSFAKQAMAQVGEAREITVRLHPQDVARAEGQGLTDVMESLCAAQVNIQSAPDLEVGDIELDTDLGFIDGRIETRLQAMFVALKERD